jgi:hypothetical protein
MAVKTNAVPALCTLLVALLFLSSYLPHLCHPERDNLVHLRSSSLFFDHNLDTTVSRPPFWVICPVGIHIVCDWTFFSITVRRDALAPIAERQVSQ